MKIFFIHVGLPKTGTTYLQNEVFPFLKNIFYWKVNIDETYIKYITNLQYLNPIITPLNEIKSILDEYFRNIKERKILVSYEGLFGVISGGFFINYSSNFYITNFLRELFPEAKIILVIRRQDCFVESIYRQLVREGYYQPVDKFLNYKEGKFDNYIPFHYEGVKIDIKSLNYLKYVENYIRCFGEKKVLVLPYELLKEDKNRFFRKISSFLNIDDAYLHETRIVNRSYSFIQGKIALFLNRFFIFPGKHSCGFIPQKPFYDFLKNNSKRNAYYKMLFAIVKRMSLSSFLNIIGKVFYVNKNFIDTHKRQLIMDYYKDSNSKLDVKLNLSLKKYGYY